MNKKVKLLDCTLRDGGYYTNWDFDKKLVTEYCKAMEVLPIDYIEIGYRSIPLEGYLGEYFYCPEYVMKFLKDLMPSKKLVIILDEKNIRVEHAEALLKPCLPYISMVRMAVDPKNLKRAIELAEKVKKMGFEVAFNVMYMSSWKADPSFLNLLENIDTTIDYFYMVDSFGGVLPKDVKEILSLVKTKTKVPVGFHGHDNLEMALINTLTAMDDGCEIVDATITGMGRGAGNLRTELLLTYLNASTGLNVDFTKLSGVVSKFELLKKQYEWGTNLPYMFSGAHSLPQKQVMEWVGKNRYPISSIVNALNNQKKSLDDNVKLPVFEKTKKYDAAIILGGGKSIEEHAEALGKLFEVKNNICIVHAGARNVSNFINLNLPQYYALSGFESEKLQNEVGDLSFVTQTCVYPPFPRNMGTVIPEEIKLISKELDKIDFTKNSSDSPLAVAIQISMDLGVSEIMLAGFDGYNTSKNKNQFALAKENQDIINDSVKLNDIKVFSLTPTKYENIKVTSIYSFLK